MHDLVERIAHKLAEERGEELGCDMNKVRRVCASKQRTRCALGVAAVRARAVARAARRPLVGCTTVQANRLLAGSCSAPTSLSKAPARTRRPTAADGYYGMEGGRWEPRSARTM